jgi:hypothetical protein
MHHGKVGLIPRMKGCFNISKSLNTIQHINRSKENIFFISILKAEKGFDMIQHHFMIKALV